MSKKELSNKERANLLRSAASALEHGRHATAQKKIAQAELAVIDSKKLIQFPKKEGAVIDALQAMVNAAHLVVSHWSQGDLANAVNELQNVAEDARQTLLYNPAPELSATTQTISQLRQTDETLDILDKAIDASEDHLKNLLGQFEPVEIAEAFADHVLVHLQDELVNIKLHGHRNDNLDDAPIEPQAPYALVVVHGGIAYLNEATGCEVDILDLDNLKGDIEQGEKIEPLTENEETFLRDDNPELFAAYEKLKDV